MLINALSNSSLFDTRVVPAHSNMKPVQYSILPSDNISNTNDENNNSIRYYYDHHGNHSYNEPLHRFHEFFLEYYGYTSITVCAFGVITNVINISVLMAKEMRTPTNQFLIALATFDILTMLPYIPFAYHFNCPPLDPYYNPEAFSHSWVFFLVIVTHLMGTTHVVSMWMAVSLAFFRYSQIRRPCHRGPLAKERRIKSVRIVIVIVTVISTSVLIPNYFTQAIEPLPHPSINTSFYRIRDNKVGADDMHTFVLTNYLIYGILGKIVPCLLILIFSGHLIYHMSVKNIRRRQRFSAMVQQWKTTHMLLVVLILFILTELPQGILIVISATVEGFFDNTYYYLGDLMDFASLINNAINFVLYCAMSQQFRDQFMTMYVNKWRRLVGSSPRSKSCHSEVLTMREGLHRPTTTTTHAQEDQKTAKL